MPAIEISGLNKSFAAGKKVLHDIDFTVEEGELVALIGASGSGKSTLMRHISGLIPGDRVEPCRVNVMGRTLQRGGVVAPAAGAIRRDIGFVFQQFNLVGRMSVLTNVLVGALARLPAWRGYLGLFPKGERRRAMEALHRVGIPETARQRASTLSGGQQQRAAIARALVQRARILLADEPIASLDPVSSRRIMETITAVNRQDGITALVSLHQVEYALEFFPRTVALKDGRIAYDGPSAALTPSRLRDLYGAQADDLLIHHRPALPPATHGIAVAMPAE